MIVDTLFLYDRNENYMGILSNVDREMCSFWSDDRYERLDNTASTLEFTTFLKHNSGVPERIENEGFLVFKDRDGEFVKFKIVDVVEDRIRRVQRVLAFGSWIENGKEFLEPFSNRMTPEEHLDYFLRNTNWRRGQVAYREAKTISSDKILSVLEATQRIRSTFGLEPRYRIALGLNGQITGQYCDLLEHRGRVHPNRFEIGKDVDLLERNVNTFDLATALYGFGQSDETNADTFELDFSGVEWSKAKGDPTDKPFGQKWVGSDDALAKWGGKNKKHKFGVHESTVQGDAKSLLQHTWEVLQRRSQPKVTYKVDLSILGDVVIGDTLHIVDLKDEDRELVLEARVLELEGPISDKNKGKATLGNYREIEKTDVKAILEDRLQDFATKTYANNKSAEAKVYAVQKDEEIKNGLRDGSIIVDSSAIHGMIQSGQIDLNLAVQTTSPFASSDNVYYGLGPYFMTLSKYWERAFVMTLMHQKRYLTFRVFGMWEESGSDPITDGMCQVALSTTKDMSGFVSGTYTEFKVKWPSEGARTITIDMGTPTGELRDYHLLFRAQGTDNGNTVPEANARVGYKGIHD